MAVTVTLKCYDCSEEIISADEGCQASGRFYHTTCFLCCSCGRTLKGKAFYNVNGRIYCEEDYECSGLRDAAEKCANCGHRILDIMLEAAGRFYHPGCFQCSVCKTELETSSFAVDKRHRIFCLHDYHVLYAPKCFACGLAIMPAEDSDETVRVVSMDKDFHVDCFNCKGCHMQLTDEPEKRCHPWFDDLFCRNCYLERASHASSEQLFKDSFQENRQRSALMDVQSPTIPTGFNSLSRRNGSALTSPVQTTQFFFNSLPRKSKSGSLALHNEARADGSQHNIQIPFKENTLTSLASHPREAGIFRLTPISFSNWPRKDGTGNVNDDTRQPQTWGNVSSPDVNVVSSRPSGVSSADMMAGNSNDNIRSSTNQTASLKITLAPSVHNEFKGSRRFSDDSNRSPREITILPAAQTDLHLTLGNNRAPFLSQKQNPRIDPNSIYRPENIENGDSTPTSPLDSDHVHDTVLILPRENSNPGYNTSPPTNSDVGLKTFTKRPRHSEQTGSSGLPDGLNKFVDSKPNQGNASFPETSHPVQSQNTRSNGETYKGQSRPFEAVEMTASAPPKKVAYVQLQPTRAVERLFDKQRHYKTNVYSYVTSDDISGGEKRTAFRN